MSRQTARLGHCPRCETPLAEHDVLIQYDRTDGTEYYAECPNCEAVVHPVRSEA